LVNLPEYQLPVFSPTIIFCPSQYQYRNTGWPQPPNAHPWTSQAKAAWNVDQGLSGGQWFMRMKCRGIYSASMFQFSAL
jgi:hypothetical protein